MRAPESVRKLMWEAERGAATQPAAEALSHLSSPKVLATVAEGTAPGRWLPMEASEPLGRGLVQRLEQLATCPLCGSLFEDPVLLACEHSFCRPCLDRRWGTPPPPGSEAPPTACPCCGRPCPRRSLRSNVRLAVEVRISRELREKLAEPGARTGKRRGGRIPTMGCLAPHGEVRQRCASRVRSCRPKGPSAGSLGKRGMSPPELGPFSKFRQKMELGKEKQRTGVGGGRQLSSERCREGVDALPRAKLDGCLSLGRGAGGKGLGQQTEQEETPKARRRARELGGWEKTPLGAPEAEARRRGGCWVPGRLVREIRTRPAEEKQEGGWTKSWSGGAGKEAAVTSWEEGREADPNSPAVSWGGSPGSGLGLAVLLLLSSAPPRAPGRGGHGWRQGPGKQTLGPLAPLHIPL